MRSAFRYGLVLRANVVTSRAPEAEHERGQQPDDAGAHDRSLARLPHLQPPLDLIRLVNSFLDYRRGLEQHANVLQSLWHLHDEFDVVHVVLGQISMAQVDAALVVDVVGGHVIGADQVIDTLAGPAHGGDDIVVGSQFGHVRAYGFHAAEAFVADDQEIVSWRGGAVFGRVDFLVGTVHTDTKNLYQYSPAVGDLVELGLVQIGRVDAVGFSREHTDGFQCISPL
jgi:hypothetical protein